MTNRSCLITVRPLSRSIEVHGTELVTLAEFDSYETMRNTNDPETAEYGTQVCECVEGPVTFHHPDVRRVMQARRQ